MMSRPLASLVALSVLLTALVVPDAPAHARLDTARIAGSWTAVAVQFEGRVTEIRDDDGVLVTFGGAPGWTFKIAMALGPMRRVLTGTWQVQGETLVMIDGETGDASRASVELRGPLMVLNADSGMTLILQRGTGT